MPRNKMEWEAAFKHANYLPWFQEMNSWMTSKEIGSAPQPGSHEERVLQGAKWALEHFMKRVEAMLQQGEIEK